MVAKEKIVLYLGRIGRATLPQIAAAIIKKYSTTAVHLTYCKRKGLIRPMRWADGSRVWMLTNEGYGRYEYYVKREEAREKAGQEVN